MNRLKHAEKAFLQGLKVSRADVLIFVEGKTGESFFVSQICNSICKRRNVDVKIYSAQEIPGEVHGKYGLISYYRKLKRESLLFISYKGKNKAVMFFLDKDIDDILRCRLRSKNVIYTRYYEFENYIYLEGDIVKGAAAAASIDPKEIQDKLGDSKAWCLIAAGRWTEWVKLCIMARLFGKNPKANYGRVSKINNHSDGKINKRKKREYLEDLCKRCGMKKAEFKELYSRISNRVERYFQRGKQDYIFKGKWYSGILLCDFKKCIGAKPYDSKGLQNKLTSTIASTVDYDAAWAGHLRAQIERVIDSLKGMKK